GSRCRCLVRRVVLTSRPRYVELETAGGKTRGVTRLADAAARPRPARAGAVAHLQPCAAERRRSGSRGNIKRQHKDGNDRQRGRSKPKKAHAPSNATPLPPAAAYRGTQCRKLTPPAEAGTRPRAWRRAPPRRAGSVLSCRGSPRTDHKACASA